MLCLSKFTSHKRIPDSKARWVHVGSTWSRQDPRWVNVGPTKFAVGDVHLFSFIDCSISTTRLGSALVENSNAIRMTSAVYHNWRCSQTTNRIKKLTDTCSNLKVCNLTMGIFSNRSMLFRSLPSSFCPLQIDVMFIVVSVYRYTYIYIIMYDTWIHIFLYEDIEYIPSNMHKALLCFVLLWYFHMHLMLFIYSLSTGFFPCSWKMISWGLFLLTWINSAWIGNHMPCKVSDEITYQFLNFNGCAFEV